MKAQGRCFCFVWLGLFLSYYWACPVLAEDTVPKAKSRPPTQSSRPQNFTYETFTPGSTPGSVAGGRRQEIPLTTQAPQIQGLGNAIEAAQEEEQQEESKPYKESEAPVVPAKGNK